MPLDQRFFVAYDAGGSKVRAGVFDNGGELFGAVFEGENLRGKPKLEYLEAVGNCIEDVIRLSELSGQIQAIGGSQAGLIKDGIISFAPNVKEAAGSDQGVRNLDIGKYLSERFSLPAYIENDGSMAAFGVWRLDPQADGLTDIFYIIMGTGIGAGAIVNGEMLKKPLEVGHTPMAKENRKCGCGLYGCWEAASSGSGIKRIANSESYVANRVRKTLGICGDVDSQHLFEAARKGCPPAMKIIDECHEANAKGVATIINYFGPQAVFIGESVARGNEEVLKQLRIRVPPSLIPGLPVPKIRLSYLNDPGLRGAALYAKERIGRKP